MNERRLAPSTEAPEDEESKLHLLRLLEAHPDFSQRELSNRLGMSLGKTHYLLRALLDKGLVKAQNFRRNDNKWGYLYVLTPTGLRRKLQLTKSYLALKEQEFDSLTAQIAALRQELDKGSGTVTGAPADNPRR